MNSSEFQINSSLLFVEKALLQVDSQYLLGSRYIFQQLVIFCISNKDWNGVFQVIDSANKYHPKLADYCSDAIHFPPCCNLLSFAEYQNLCDRLVIQYKNLPLPFF
eukprot:Sdes_comp9573_c0_seq1m1053